jgi:hypothetical protein
VVGVVGSKLQRRLRVAGVRNVSVRAIASDNKCVKVIKEERSCSGQVEGLLIMEVSGNAP